MKKQITLKVNGENHEVEIEANRLLLQVLETTSASPEPRKAAASVFAALAASSSTAAWSARV